MAPPIIIIIIIVVVVYNAFIVLASIYGLRSPNVLNGAVKRFSMDFIRSIG